MQEYKMFHDRKGEVSPKLSPIIYVFWLNHDINKLEKRQSGPRERRSWETDVRWRWCATASAHRRTYIS